MLFGCLRYADSFSSVVSEITRILLNSIISALLVKVYIHPLWKTMGRGHVSDQALISHKKEGAFDDGVKQLQGPIFPVPPRIKVSISSESAHGPCFHSSNPEH